MLYTSILVGMEGYGLVTYQNVEIYAKLYTSTCSQGAYVVK